MPCEIRERFIVKSEKEAYEQWLGDLIPTIKDYINQGIKIHVFKGEIVDISCSKRSLSMDEKVRVSYVGEKYLLCLNKLEEDKNAK